MSHIQPLVIDEYKPDVFPNAYTCKFPVEVPMYNLSAGYLC